MPQTGIALSYYQEMVSWQISWNWNLWRSRIKTESEEKELKYEFTKIEELEMFYEAAGFVGVYEKELSKMNELQIEKLYKETFSHE